jgi:hypothetical protein
MRGFIRAALVALALGSSSAVVARAAPPAKAPTAAKPKTLGETLTGQAKADYDSARLLVTDGDYAGARIKFQGAYDASKDPRLLFNVAAAEKQLRHYARAIELLKKYSSDTSVLVTPKDKSEALEFIKTLEPFTVAVTFEVNEPDADVEVDDAMVGKTPLAAPIVIDIGQHKVRVHKESFRDFATSASVGGSAQQTILVKLEKEVHAGKLAVVVPAGASVLIDGKAVSTGTNKDPLELKLPSGGHTLRVTAPGMRSYEREVVVKDNETRAVEVTLEREAEPERPKLRVAVGCGSDPEIRGTDDGLTIYLDGTPAAATASGGKKTWDPELGRNRVDFIEFPVESGPHRVIVRIAGCAEMETSVDVTPVDGGEIHGRLHSTADFIARGPAGNPNWGRIGVGVWLPSVIGGMEGVEPLPGPNQPRLVNNPKYRPQAAGIIVQPGLAFRWFSLGLDLAVASGGAAPSTEQGFAPAEISAGIPENTADITWTRLGFRAGARIPLNVAAFHLGVGTGYDHFTVNKLPKGFMWALPDKIYVGAWSSLDIQVFCDWAAFGGAQFDGYLQEFVKIKDVLISPQFGVAFQPNRACHGERASDFGLRPSSTEKR